MLIRMGYFHVVFVILLLVYFVVCCSGSNYLDWGRERASFFCYCFTCSFCGFLFSGEVFSSSWYLGWGGRYFYCGTCELYNKEKKNNSFLDIIVWIFEEKNIFIPVINFVYFELFKPILHTQSSFSFLCC